MATKHLLTFLISISCFSVAFANDPVPIGNVLSSPNSYQLHVVTLQGKVREIELAKPYGSKCGLVFNGFTFSLEDDTGLIQVFVGGHCRQASYKEFPVKEGEAVLVEGQIEVQNVENPVRPAIQIRSRALWRAGNPQPNRSLP